MISVVRLFLLLPPYGMQILPSPPPATFTEVKFSFPRPVLSGKDDDEFLLSLSSVNVSIWQENPLHHPLSSLATIRDTPGKNTFPPPKSPPLLKGVLTPDRGKYFNPRSPSRQTAIVFPLLVFWRLPGLSVNWI